MVSLCVILYILYFIAPVCFNTTSCSGESLDNITLSYSQCCFELYGTSFVSSGECVLCPKGILLTKIQIYIYKYLV